MAHTRGRNSDTPTTDRLASMAHDTIDRVAETANDAEREVRGAATRGAEHAREAQDHAKEVADENLRKVRSFLEDNPLLGAGIAFVAGVVLSSLIRR
jgi:ElaB/YqjD/DUF883 family membrane-anchored ribosome-binding protein